MLQHSSLICDWLCGFILLLLVGIVVVVGWVWSQLAVLLQKDLWLLLWLCYVEVVVVYLVEVWIDYSLVVVVVVGIVVGVVESCSRSCINGGCFNNEVL